jgi:hypothetical protein
VLLTKLKEVVNVKQYMPICLLNVFYKIFTKVLAIRLMEVAEDIINKTQTTFIKNRFALEGVLMLHEVVHELEIKKQRGVIMKVDFEKAYDKMNWEFLEEVLIQKGFPRRWSDWVIVIVYDNELVYGWLRDREDDDNTGDVMIFR